ncbi:DUF11 domain-containing protein [bacterium]|nr:DUF11 domain-containing protein [bacterium]
MQFYRGYEVSRSLNGQYWFAIPDRDLTTEHKITAATAIDLRAAIDAAVDGVWDTLSPGDVVTFTAEYEVTQADVDAGQIVNTASVTGATPGGASVTDTGTATVPINPANAVRSMLLDKVASLQSYRAGQQISYNFRVQNTGTQTLTNVVVTDTTFPAFSCTIPTIAPGGDECDLRVQLYGHASGC